MCSKKKQLQNSSNHMKYFRLVTIAYILFFFPNYAAAIDVNSKSNKSAMDIQMSVRQTLDNLVDAYQNKEAGRFMSFVAEDYTGDNMLLDRAIRRDFSKFFDMQLRYSLNNITPDSGNKYVSVSVTYTRSFTDIKTAQRINKTGSAELIFRIVDGYPKLYSMKKSSMFGIGK